MSRRALLNLVLFGLLLVLGLIAWLQPGEKPEPGQPPLTQLNRTDIHTIAIERDGAATKLLERRGGDWWISEPLQVPADDFVVDSILGLAAVSSAEQIAAPVSELGKFGLDTPSLTVTLNDTAIAFGATEPISGHRYVRVGSVVHLIPDSHYFRLAGDLYSFVARTLLPPGSDIRSIRLADQVIARTADGGWTVEPETPELAADALVAFVDEWRRARAIRVSGHEDGRTDAADITVEFANQDTVQFDIFQQDDDWLLIRPEIGIQYHFTENQFRRLTTPAAHDEPVE